MSKLKAAAAIFGGLTSCMAGVLLAGYAVSPTVGTAASRSICTVTENMNGSVSYIPLENTVITDSSEKEKETDDAVSNLAFDGANNAENIRKTSNTSETEQNGEYRFAVTNIKPASYEEPVFVPVHQESSVDIYSQYKGETPAVENYVKENTSAEENNYGQDFGYSDGDTTEPENNQISEESSKYESFEFTIEEITESEEEESTEPEAEETTEPETEETTEPETEENTEPETEENTEPETEETTETEPEETTTATERTIYIEPTVTTQYVAQPAEPETQPQEEEDDTPSNPTIPLTDSEYIALCNAVAHEAGCNWISTRDKANVVEVIMNRVYSSLFPNSVIEVLTQPNQFTGAEGYAYLGYFTSDVSQDVIDAVNLYFSQQESFNEGYFYFYGDGYQNHFSQGGWW